jgi:hypothetical protein
LKQIHNYAESTDVHFLHQDWNELKFPNQLKFCVNRVSRHAPHLNNHIWNKFTIMPNRKICIFFIRIETNWTSQISWNCGRSWSTYNA